MQLSLVQLSVPVINGKAETELRDGQIDRSKFEIFTGQTAGVCYMPDTYQTLISEPVDKSLKRFNMIMSNGHHSVADHTMITLEIEHASKLFAMFLNNEKYYATSEKSARYTKMDVVGLVAEIRSRWDEILFNEIKAKYGHQFNDAKIKKLASENSRYFTSIMTPTTFVYTTSIRQLNYMAHWFQQIANRDNELYKLIYAEGMEFCNQLESLGLYYPELRDGKNRLFSLLGTRIRNEHFLDTYSVNYKGTYAMLAQAQRHRTLSYEIMPMKDKEYYIPKILSYKPELVDLWISDMDRVSDLYPQGELLFINERGTVENLVLKSAERLCAGAQKEIADTTKFVMDRFVAETPDQELREYVAEHSKGARCTSGFKCNAPCGFKEGINLTRDI